MERWLHTGFVLLFWQQCPRTKIPEAHMGKQDPKLPQPAGLVLHVGSSPTKLYSLMPI
jgi:hypothetical protein